MMDAMDGRKFWGFYHELGFHLSIWIDYFINLELVP